MASRAPEDLGLSDLVATVKTDPRLEVENVVVEKVELKPDSGEEAVVKQRPLQPLVRREDSWFLLFNVATRRASYVAPGNYHLIGPRKHALFLYFVHDLLSLAIWVCIKYIYIYIYKDHITY